MNGAFKTNKPLIECNISILFIDWLVGKKKSELFRNPINNSPQRTLHPYPPNPASNEQETDIRGAKLHRSPNSTQKKIPLSSLKDYEKYKNSFAL